MSARGVIIGLSALGGLAAAIVGAVSLTRISGDFLGFPAALTWTFTAAVDIGAIAGAVMWSTNPRGSDHRRTGVRMNVTCSTVSAVGVGLDHATNANPLLAWQITAFLVGAFLPLLSTWLVHALAKLTGATAVLASETLVVTPAEIVDETPVERVEPDAAPRPQRQRRRRRSLAVAGQVRQGNAHAWAKQNWPTTAPDVMEATGCSRSTAFRAVQAAREEEVSNDGAAVA